MSESSEPELLVIVPTRGRPHNAVRAMNAWVSTNAFTHADLLFAVDADDRAIERYRGLKGFDGLGFMEHPTWMPMVHKLDRTVQRALGPLTGSLTNSGYRYVAFMGDDHVPRTDGWAKAYCDALADLGTGIVYGNDLVQGAKLCTQWAMTMDIVRALGRMVPAPVEHMYCDNSIKELGWELGILRYLPDVTIEHAHPIAGRGAWDEGYERVNSREQYKRDFEAFRGWRDGEGFRKDVELIKNVISVNAKETTP